jgi:hypothetical protein
MYGGREICPRIVLGEREGHLTENLNRSVVFRRWQRIMLDTFRKTPVQIFVITSGPGAVAFAIRMDRRMVVPHCNDNHPRGGPICAT